MIPCSVTDDGYVDASATSPLEIFYHESVNGFTFPAATLKAAGSGGRTYAVTSGTLPVDYTLDASTGVI